MGDSGLAAIALAFALSTAAPSVSVSKRVSPLLQCNMAVLIVVAALIITQFWMGGSPSTAMPQGYRSGTASSPLLGVFWQFAPALRGLVYSFAPNFAPLNKPLYCNPVPLAPFSGLLERFAPSC